MLCIFHEAQLWSRSRWDPNVLLGAEQTLPDGIPWGTGVGRFTPPPVSLRSKATTSMAPLWHHQCQFFSKAWSKAHSDSFYFDFSTFGLFSKLLMSELVSPILSALDMEPSFVSQTFVLTTQEVLTGGLIGTCCTPWGTQKKCSKNKRIFKFYYVCRASSWHCHFVKKLYREYGVQYSLMPIDWTYNTHTHYITNFPILFLKHQNENDNWSTILRLQCTPTELNIKNASKDRDPIKPSLIVTGKMFHSILISFCFFKSALTSKKLFLLKNW